MGPKFRPAQSVPIPAAPQCGLSPCLETSCSDPGDETFYEDQIFAVGEVDSAAQTAVNEEAFASLCCIVQAPCAAASVFQQACC